MRKSETARIGALGGTALAALMLAACGGGGGGVASTPAPTTTTTPTTTTDTTTPPVAATTPLPTSTTTAPVATTTTPATTTTTTTTTTAAPGSPTLATTPNSTNYVTLEYQRSVGPRAMNAAAAYNKGATGQGVTIAFTDSGIDIESAEFAGRISSASRDIVSGRSVDDDSGHGTSVAAVALAAKNDAGIQGVAFNATALMLRTDTPGSCSGTDGCSHNDANLARGIDAAVAAGARIVNMSLGGSPPSLSLRQAFARATRAGTIIVISAGNDGTADPDPLAQIANDATVANGLILIAGSVGTAADANAISDFSDRAGNGASHYIAASGYRVRSFDQTGQAFLFSGTSYSAPHVAGALALLLQAFPSLTAAQAIDILFRSAADAGGAGVDAIYGQGILDLTKAFQPIGSASLAGSAIPVSLDDNGELGGAMGDGGQLGTALGHAVILDGYARAFTADLGRSLRAQPVSRPLASRLSGRARGASFGGGDRLASFTAAPGLAPAWSRPEQTGFDVSGGGARVVSGFAASAIDAKTLSGVAFGYAPQTLANVLTGRPGAPFLTDAPAGDLGLGQRAGASAAIVRQVGGWRLGLAGGAGRVADTRPLGLSTQDRRDGGTATVAATAAHRLGPATLTAGLTQLDERATVLGGQMRGGLGLSGATTRLASLEASADLGGWALSAGARGGWTSVRLAPGLVTGIGALVSFGWQADAVREGLFGRDRLAFRVAQPLRVEHGVATLAVPVDYDYATGLAGTERRAAALAPSGREVDFETAYGRPLLGGWLDANLYLRRDPGHVAGRADDLGAALRFARDF